MRKQQVSLTNAAATTAVASASSVLPNGQSYDSNDCASSSSSSSLSSVYNNGKILRTNLAAINEQQLDICKNNIATKHCYKKPATSPSTDDEGYDTCGLYYLPPHRASNKIDLRFDFTKALILLCNNNNLNGGGKHHYFIETSIDYNKSFQYFHSDIDDLWDVYATICRNSFVCYNNLPPKRFSMCRRQTNTTTNEYKIKICEHPYQMSVTFGFCTNTNANIRNGGSGQHNNHHYPKQDANSSSGGSSPETNVTKKMLGLMR